MLGAFKPQGAFGWYAAWNIVGFFAILLFVPETKALTLEELDQGTYFPKLRRQQYSHTPSLLCTDTNPCRIPNQGAPSQHQEVHLPHESRSFTASLRT